MKRGDQVTINSTMSFIDRILYKGFMLRIIEKKFNRSKMKFSYKCLVA